jgi:hypothetical protein
MKSTKPWRKKSKKTPEDGKTSHAHGLEELISWKWLSYQKQSTNSMQAYQNSNVILTEIEELILKLFWKNNRP